LSDNDDEVVVPTTTQMQTKSVEMLMLEGVENENAKEDQPEIRH
jgi:hypothetical protein